MIVYNTKEQAKMKLRGMSIPFGSSILLDTLEGQILGVQGQEEIKFLSMDSLPPSNGKVDQILKLDKNGNVIRADDTRSTSSRGPVQYDGRDYTWDGNIWLGRAFRTTVPPLDWWQGYLQEYAYFSRALTPVELNLLYRVYKGNMLPSTSKSPSIDSWGATRPFVCTGGTGTTEDNIKPNMTAASETNKIITSAINGLYFSRSMSPDVGVEGSLGGYSLKATVTVSGITIPYNITGSMKEIKNNLDGSGAYLPVNNGVFPKGDIVFEFTFQGVTQKFIVTKTG